VDIKPIQQIQLENRLIGLKKVMDYLYDGEQECFTIMYFIKQNYKQWQDILLWMYKNQLKGKKMIQMFQNESPDGGGYHMGVMHIVSRLDGMKHEIRNIKLDELR